jgi:hypothetical protein
MLTYSLFAKIGRIAPLSDACGPADAFKKMEVSVQVVPV